MQSVYLFHFVLYVNQNIYITLICWIEGRVVDGLMVGRVDSISIVILITRSSVLIILEIEDTVFNLSDHKASVIDTLRLI